MRKFILSNSRLKRAHSSQCSAVQCSTIKNYQYVNQQMIPFPITRNPSRAKQPLWVSREKCIWIITMTSENICLFKLIKKKTRKRLSKMALPKFSLAAQKIWVAQNLGRLQPPSPPRPVRLCFYDLSTIGQSLNTNEHLFESFESI